MIRQDTADTAGNGRIRQDTEGYGRIRQDAAEYGRIQQETAGHRRIHALQEYSRIRKNPNDEW